MPFSPKERIAQVIRFAAADSVPGAGHSQRAEKSPADRLRLNPSSGGIVVVSLRGNVSWSGAVLCSADDDLLLVSANGASIRFSATDRRCGQWVVPPGCAQGMRFKYRRWLLSLNVVREGTYLLVATSRLCRNVPRSEGTRYRAAAVSV